MNDQGIFVEAIHEHGSVDDVVNAQEAAPKKILVVDDELFQLRHIHVHNVAADFYNTVSDVTDPIFDNLWDVARAIPDLNASDWEPDAAASYLASDEAVSTVLLSDAFDRIARQELKGLLTAFITRAARVNKLKKIFLDAFPAPAFDLQFAEAARPPLARVMQCEAIFLDLFLEQGDASPIETLQNYLFQLATEADSAVLPPLILMSSHPELEQHRLHFSEKAGISAAGLMVLPKEALMEPEFGPQGLKLAFTQLNRQKNTAHVMRLFIRSWLSALNTAREKTAKTLWNLDASAMQHIHHASVSDSDPYDEHLNELLSREHMFHVEADTSVVTIVTELDKQFCEHLTTDGKIENRLIAPLSDVDTARAFMSHFTWLGSPAPDSFLADNDQDAAAQVSRSLPFGCVLSSGMLTHGSRCLVHITQQCDLNTISRSKNASRPLIFATADATELQLSDNPIVQTTELVAKSLRLTQGGSPQEFDLRVNVGELFALPLSDFLKKARSENWHVIGRLRSDITNHIVAATTNQMSRPASQKMIRPALLPSKVFLQSAAFATGNKIALIDKNSFELTKPAKQFSLSRDGDSYSFQDNACIEIALWLAHHSDTIGLQLDPDALSACLRRGWVSPMELPGGLKVRVRECNDLREAYKGVVGGDTSGKGAQLTVIIKR